MLRKKFEAGFTLIEATLAIVLLIIGMSALFRLQYSTLQSGAMSTDIFQASAIADSLYESLLLESATNFDGPGLSCISPATCTGTHIGGAYTAGGTYNNGRQTASWTILNDVASGSKTVQISIQYTSQRNNAARVLQFEQAIGQNLYSSVF